MVEPKIAAISDTHNHDLRDIIIPDGDILIHAGDISSIGSIQEITKALAQLSALPHKHILLTAGNHDFGIKDVPIPGNITLLMHEPIRLMGLNFFGSPYTPRYGNWAFMHEPGRLKELWGEIPTDTDILITHGPAYGVLDQNKDGENCGCKELSKAIGGLKLKAHIFGHIHEQGGKSEGIAHNVSVVDERYRVVRGAFRGIGAWERGYNAN